MTAGRRADPRAEAPSLAELWRVATPLTRAALLVAGSSAAVIVGTFLGLTASGPGLAVYALHLAAMVLGLTLVGRVMWHHLWIIRRPHAEPGRTPIPRSLKVLTCVAFAVWLLLFIVSFTTYGEGGPEPRGGQYVWVRDGADVRAMTVEEHDAFQAGVLRVFAAAWLAFSLMTAWAGHVVDTRNRQVRNS